MDLPQIIYKYRSWEKEYDKDILIKNNLFLSSPQYFNDPFDCRIPINYSLLDTQDKRKKYVDKFITENFDWLTSSGTNIENEISALDKKLEFKLDEVQENYDKDFIETYDKHYGIFSASSIWDSILMWSHYGDYHKGYCVGFWEKKLRESRIFGAGGLVQYPMGDNYPPISPLDNSKETMFKVTHHKARHWKYEKEYRLTKLFYPIVPTDIERTVQIFDDFFAEIVIGLNTPENYKSEIITIAKQKEIRVFQVVKIPFKFKLERVELK